MSIRNGIKDQNYYESRLADVISFALRKFEREEGFYVMEGEILFTRNRTEITMPRIQATTITATFSSAPPPAYVITYV